jgi:hypothetical protein
MNSEEFNTTEARRQALLGQLNAVEAELSASLELNCASVTARVHQQRALAHIQEAVVAVIGVRHARTVWQLVEDLTKGRRNLDELEPSARPAIRPSH